MSGCLAVWRKELTIYFATPIFYLTGFFFLVLAGYFFYSNIAYYTVLSFQAGQNPYLASMLSPQQMVHRPFFGNLAVILLFIAPLFTMRLFAEEKRSGTIELLFTLPLTDWGVIFGKFLAALVLYALLLAVTVLYSGAFAAIMALDWGAVVVGYLGLLLLGGAFLALGMFCSTLTENQIIAAVIAFSLLLLFWIIGWYEELGPPAYQGFFRHISMMGHFDAFARGVLDSRDVIYYLSIIFFFLFLTKRQLESRAWRG
ncbi:ABC transporter permease subunit [Desulfobacca acetoxidans]|uniref:ABC-2 type transporter n=1 Tax=Desulfobacca acetoxidans (strain ATCC 700848 / DSM 11109 / ASRB2) TaxID=880072 RepID=F2NGM3_DESAR|nr:ABC transporter permease subunit [Desulfobacca acetoxidans]AEB07930.1 ABC-2 type transporter [Desulfobacca acetoxidans DSM 11109]HAY23106.1 ABC transporter permease [Desulfobacterales bacterium]